MMGALLLSSNVLSLAQFKNQYAIGVAFTPEWQLGQHATDLIGGADYDFKAFSPSFGITAEGQFDKHSGVELGVFYRASRYHITSILIGAPSSTFVDQNRSDDYLSLRLAYKFYSEVLNFKVGFMGDFGAKDNLQKENLFGANFTVSKDITLYKGLILEPEIRYTLAIDAEKENLIGIRRDSGPLNFLGGGVKLKYRF